ncbi:mannitol dehydrogenase family protein [Ruminococcaceae bacterium OttesenSCG-928-L11]|nr:mannitol dehydrogenase family protein [Ruminococcaceae bacterium OttesenSCG-928-L11]
MAKLTLDGLTHREHWDAAGIRLPAYDVKALRQRTCESPRWVHVGPGNIFRGYIAALAQTLIESGKMDTGITTLSTFDHQIMEKIYKPYDNLALQVIMHADGSLDKTVIASIGESVKADAEDPADWPRIREIFANPGLQMVSFTITEKGYHIKNMDGNYFPDVLSDFERQTEIPRNGMAILAALLQHRYESGGHPITLVSMDNFSHNGDKLADSVCTVAQKWVENGTAPAGFLDWLRDKSKVAFPWSMIDKITPRPDPTVSKTLTDSGFADTELVITDKNTYIAPFVNAEAPQYLVIEDTFPGGRPPLEDAGVYFTTRDTVDRVERMKVCTCLNPLHTAMSIFGCVLGFSSIAEEMKDPDICALVNRIGYVEGMPVVTNPGILEPEAFLKEVIQVRLPNPYIPDTPQRIATDTSQKLAIRFGETIKLYRKSADLDTASLTAIPLAIAAWCRYLMGIDDEGQTFAISPDPLLEQLQGYIAPLAFGNPDSVGDNLRPILSNTHIFGVDLYEDSLGGKVEDYCRRMLAGKGTIRAVLHEELQ